MEQLKYRIFAQNIKDKIACGEYPVGTRLPGEHRLVTMHGLSRHTIRKAIEVLCEEKVIEKIHGSGTYVLKSHAREKSMLVGLLATHISLPNFSPVIQGIEQTLADKGYSAIIKTTDNRFDLERKALEALIKMNVDAVIVEPVKPTLPNPNIDLYNNLIEMNVKLVFINSQYSELENCICVSMNNKQGGLAMGQHLVQKGYYSIAAVFKANDQESVARYASLAQYLTKAGLQMADNNVLWFTSLEDEESFEKSLLLAVKGCRAVACFNDEIAFKAIQIFQKQGISVPYQLAVIAFDNSIYSEISPVKITALNHAQVKMGKLAAIKLQNLIENKEETSVQIPWKLIEKEST